MSKKFWSLFILELVAIQLPYVSHAQDVHLSVDKEHMVGVIESHLASLEGWRTGDVLIRIATTGEGKHVEEGETIHDVVQPKEVVGPGAKNLVIREDLLFRLVFDFDTERALVINRCEREERLFNGLDEEIKRPVIRIDNRVLLYDKSKDHAFMRLEAGQIHKMQKLPPLTQLLHSMNARDIRHLGCAEASYWDLSMVRTQLEFGAAERHIHSLVNTGRDRFQVVLRDEEGSPFQGQYAIDWDVSRNVPVRFVSHHVPPEASQPVHTATVDWNSYEGNYLPKFARLSQRSIPEYANQTFQLIEETTVEIHWYSFNKEPLAEFFDEKLLHDQKKLDEMLNTDVFEDLSKEDRKDK